MSTYRIYDVFGSYRGVVDAVSAADALAKYAVQQGATFAKLQQAGWSAEMKSE